MSASGSSSTTKLITSSCPDSRVSLFPKWQGTGSR
jgi:hypothetical protein